MLACRNQQVVSAVTHFGPQHSTRIGANRVAAHLLQLLDDTGSRCLSTAADCRHDSCLQARKQHTHFCFWHSYQCTSWTEHSSGQHAALHTYTPFHCKLPCWAVDTCETRQTHPAASAEAQTVVQ